MSALAHCACAWIATLLCVGCVAVREGPALAPAERAALAPVADSKPVVAVREPVVALDSVDSSESLSADRYLKELHRSRRLIRRLRGTALFREVGFERSLRDPPDLTLVSLPLTTPEEASAAFQVTNSLAMLLTLGIVPFVWPRDEGVRFARVDAPGEPVEFRWPRTVVYSPTFLSPFVLVGSLPGWHYDVYMNIPEWQSQEDAIDARFAAFVVEQSLLTREADPHR